jgi:hypothetical protein
MAKLRGSGDMEENTALAVAYTCGNTSAKHILRAFKKIS